MNDVYLSLGSNQGNRIRWLEQAVKLLQQKCGVVASVSSYYETKAWGITDQPDFINMCVCLQTELTALDLLVEIHSIETQLGRQRHIKWGPRTLDIDILFYNHDIITVGDLILPHPFLQERMFVLMPLCDIAAGYVHPVLNKTVSQLLAECPDELNIKKFDGVVG